MADPEFHRRVWGKGRSPIPEYGAKPYYYRLQRSCGQGNIFAPVCHSVHRGLYASVNAGMPPPRSRHPPEQTPPQGRHPLGADPPQKQTPQEQIPPQKQTSPNPPRADTPPKADPPKTDTPQEQTPPTKADPPQEQTPPPRKADSGIWSMSGRYAPYWNAFLFNKIFDKNCMKMKKRIGPEGALETPQPPPPRSVDDFNTCQNVEITSSYTKLNSR